MTYQLVSWTSSVNGSSKCQIQTLTHPAPNVLKQRNDLIIFNWVEHGRRRTFGWQKLWQKWKWFFSARGVRRRGKWEKKSENDEKWKTILLLRQRENRFATCLWFASRWNGTQLMMLINVEIWLMRAIFMNYLHLDVSRLVGMRGKNKVYV